MCFVIVLALMSLCAATSEGSDCVVPTTQICSVSYLVPPSIAAVSSYLEDEISWIYNSEKTQLTGACLQSLKEIRCAQSFPRCSNDSFEVTVTSLDCRARLNQCANTNPTFVNMLLRDNFCNLTEKTFPFSGCKPLATYGYNFNYCPVNDTRNVTEWMFALLKYEDVRFTNTQSFLSKNFPDCAPLSVRYQCVGKIGQCDECLSRSNIIVNYTRDQCNQFKNVCNSNSYVFVPNCTLWPSEVVRVPCGYSTTTTNTSPSSWTTFPVSSNAFQTKQTAWVSQTQVDQSPPASNIPQTAGTPQRLLMSVVIAIAVLATLVLAAGLILIIVALILMRCSKRKEHDTPNREDTRELDLSYST